MRSLTRSLSPGSSAVLALVHKSTPDKALPELGTFGGSVLNTSLSHEAEEEFQAALTAARVRATALRAATRARQRGPRRAERQR